jgi:hypothetical protein
MSEISGAEIKGYTVLVVCGIEFSINIVSFKTLSSII